jgi:hypothetical protein
MGQDKNLYYGQIQ